ncbi:4-oxalocrotonate tautomerase [Undibacterium sp. JH2W]|uniref:4-oxalocrotonate tautomerase n=1 Tax=Undibacterium sp. JH2W TaxID=3413037 RepID=UPI003BF2226E
MPISVQVTTGLLTIDGEREVLPLVADALLRVHGLTGNKFMTPNVVGHLVVSPEAHSYVGGQQQSLAVIEVKVPSVTFPNAEVKQAFVSEATDIIDRLKQGQHPRERTYVNGKPIQESALCSNQITCFLRRNASRRWIFIRNVVWDV